MDPSAPTARVREVLPFAMVLLVLPSLTGVALYKSSALAIKGTNATRNNNRAEKRIRGIRLWQVLPWFVIVYIPSPSLSDRRDTFSTVTTSESVEDRVSTHAS